MSMEFLVRAEMVQLEVTRLGAEARSCTDPERLVAIRLEMDVLHNSMLDIRREQLASMLPKPEGRPWWKFWGASRESQPEGDAR